MARIIVGSYMVRYPLGGMLSWVLQYLLGFQRLGHEVFFVEKSGYPESCYDPSRDRMSDDCSYGVTHVQRLLTRFGLDGNWCFVDAQQRYHGLPREQIEAAFRTADLYVEMGTQEAWAEEAAQATLRVLIDGDPGFSQVWMEMRRVAGNIVPAYDFYYTVGQNIGTDRSGAPTGGVPWRPLFHPVVVEQFEVEPVSPDAPFTTVMNWQSYEPVEFGGVLYGQKDIEFQKFLNLPRLSPATLELAVSGRAIPRERLMDAGWRVREGRVVTSSFDCFVDYVQGSLGEFSVCRNGYVASNSGWFSDRSSVYLASGRPVVLQDSGFSAHLPCGRGLFAVNDATEAAAALDEIKSDHQRHSAWAREIASEYLDAEHVLGAFLSEIGM